MINHNKSLSHINDFAAIFARVPPWNRLLVMSSFNNVNMNTVNNTDPYDRANFTIPLFISHYDYAQEVFGSRHGRDFLDNVIYKRLTQEEIIKFPSKYIGDTRRAYALEAVTGRSSKHDLLFVTTGVGAPDDEGKSTLSYKFTNQQLLSINDITSMISSALSSKGGAVAGNLFEGFSAMSQATLTGQFYAPGARRTTVGLNWISEKFNNLMFLLQGGQRGKHFGSNIKTIFLPQFTIGYADSPNPAFYIKYTKIAYKDAYFEILPMFEWLKLNLGLLTMGVFLHPFVVYSKDLVNMLVNSQLPFLSHVNSNQLLEQQQQMLKEVIGQNQLAAATGADAQWQYTPEKTTYLTLPQQSALYHSSDQVVTKNPTISPSVSNTVQVTDITTTSTTSRANEYAVEIYFVAVPSSVSISLKDFDYSDKIPGSQALLDLGTTERKFYRRIDVTFSFKLAVPFIYNANTDFIINMFNNMVNKIKDLGS